MSDRNHPATSSERQPYTTPELTRHGSLDELTHGAGSKQIEKGSAPEMAK